MELNREQLLILDYSDDYGSIHGVHTSGKAFVMPMQTYVTMKRGIKNLSQTFVTSANSAGFFANHHIAGLIFITR